MKKDYIKTSTAFVNYACSMFESSTIYMWGAIGEVVTEEFIKHKAAEYPEIYTEEKVLQLYKLVGKNVRGFDCSGLIKFFLMGGLENYKYDIALDMNSKMLLNNSPKVGSIDSLPEIPGVCLYMKGHVGIYIGEGYVIEATSNPKFGNGVVKTELVDREWLKWFYCVNISY